MDVAHLIQKGESKINESLPTVCLLYTAFCRAYSFVRELSSKGQIQFTEIVCDGIRRNLIGQLH